MVYKFKTGSYIRADAQVAGHICEELEAQGNLTAKALLEVSRPEDAPLHNAFEWDDTTAAEAYREQQARHIINCLCVVPDETFTEPTRAFFTLTRAENNYQHIETILRDEDSTEALLKKALAELEAFSRKYRQLEKLAAVFAAIDEVTLYDLVG